MCYNCGCQIPQDNMGHKANITDQTFDELAEQWNVTPKEAKKITLSYLINGLQADKASRIEEILSQAAKSWGQPIFEAKKNTQELLEKQLN